MLNAREELEAAATWLGFQHEDLSYGLKTGEHGLKLWRAWQADQKLPEFCDEGDGEIDVAALTERAKKILSYDPWKRAALLQTAED